MIPAGLVVGYHGCDLEIAKSVVHRQTTLRPSRNAHDWLGHGLYFWQDDPQRALEWAIHAAKARGSQIKTPAVLGATIDLGHCFVAAQREHIAALALAFDSLKRTCAEDGVPLPRNIGRGWANRKLDCAVFEMLHLIRKEQDQLPFDTVLAYFSEGATVYPGAAIRHQDHVQLCVRNERRIVGWFLATV